MPTTLTLKNIPDEVYERLKASPAGFPPVQILRCASG
jgi:hypothetical protein